MAELPASANVLELTAHLTWGKSSRGTADAETFAADGRVANVAPDGADAPHWSAGTSNTRSPEAGGSVRGGAGGPLGGHSLRRPAGDERPPPSAPPSPPEPAAPARTTVEAARAEERAAYQDLCAARENWRAKVATVRRTQAALDVARQTWEDACDASNQLKLIWERVLFTSAGDAIGYYALHRKQSEAAFHRSLEVNRLGNRCEQCVQSLSYACAYVRHAAQRHAEALDALGGLEAGGSAGEMAWEEPPGARLRGEARARAAWLEVRRTEEGGAADEMFANTCTTSMTKPAFQQRALRFVLRRFGLLLPGRGFFGSVAGLLAAEQTIPRARLLPRAIMAVLALLLPRRAYAST
ncbi:hypothetical protein EMIHUDRAFT_232216 [Emiliania huxleyi CCMP1516]|uniref:C2H2-type domain-containing protein n=2 Tax=Emiliania huxleyi TaxID=2903 RepID=A0A0D3K676_EMIH1|nr:hypothetical protein EMIHUDRAFT_232216 [Emiliania huxleyi CCMP1516]EOD31261.1 hypothetical protein EMIHUDRAFT_232216 [Emiliania huxleyi CCMP1516]|eukprot:XP_005783690.1 hypothetical protein EMIHUDRAFT_232216 [Emiliania huxleyi CCMP1516]